MSIATGIDSHLHLDIIRTAHPDRIQWLLRRNFIVISWSFSEHAASFQDLEKNLRGHRNAVYLSADEGLEAYFLAGIHPRCIPLDLKPERINRLLAPLLTDDRCLGIGEIGLETGSPREKEVLAAQLEIAAAALQPRQVVGIHTPRKDKVRLTREVIAMVDSFPELHPRTVIDHCRLDTVGTVLQAGFWAGITISPSKATPSDLAAIIEQHSSDLKKIMLNSDSGTEFYEDLYNLSVSDKIDTTIPGILLNDNAARFFSLPLDRGHGSK